MRACEDRGFRAESPADFLAQAAGLGDVAFRNVNRAEGPADSCMWLSTARIRVEIDGNLPGRWPTL